jgi:hypothetical protein
MPQFSVPVWNAPIFDPAVMKVRVGQKVCLRPADEAKGAQRPKRKQHSAAVKILPGSNTRVNCEVARG